jgi:hypothetical protein
VIEGDCCSARERIAKYATVTRDASSGNHMLRKPSAPVGSEIVIADAASARRRVNESSISRIDRNVAYPATLFE